MCGIFAYSGSNSAYQTIFSGLKRLEYRGHDSWGIATLACHQIKTEKHMGAVTETKLKSKINSMQSIIGIGHTRWATHGKVNKKNAIRMWLSIILLL